MSEATVKNPAISAISSTPKAALLAVLASTMLLSGCYSTGGHVPNKTRFPESVPSGLMDFNKSDKLDSGRSELPVTQRLALSDTGADKLYSFKAMGQSLRVTMGQFAQANKLNVIFDQDVEGLVNVEFHDMTLEQALDAIVDPIGIGWVQEDGAIHITRQTSRTYQIDYLRAAKGNFWADMETELKALMGVDASASPHDVSTTAPTPTGPITVASRPIQQVAGKVVSNKLTGSVLVTTSPRRMRAVDAYMQNMIKGMNRQVYIEARILNVQLQDDAAFGIDWSKISFGPSLSVSNSNIISAATGGASLKPSTGLLDYTKTFPSTFMVQNITAAIRALEEQGTVRTVSQPRIRTLNNQPALIKVGTDHTYYTHTTQLGSCTSIPSTPTNPGGFNCPGATTTETATSVTEGVMLTVTPQISPDGHITLDVVPKINKIVGVDTSPSGLSNAPQIETMETSTLVRMKDGETAVIGGLIIEEDSETGRNLPGMGNAGGGLGWLFKGKYSNKIRKELVIFITPHLIEN
jgi:MSHA type pilus biogenesis protein MshL